MDRGAVQAAMAMKPSHNQRQTSVGSELGQAHVELSRQALAVDDAQDGSASAGRAGLFDVFHLDTCYLPTGRGFGSGIFSHSRLRAVSPDVLRDRRPALGILPRSRPVATFIRVSASDRRFPLQIVGIYAAHDLSRKLVEPLKSHCFSLSSDTRGNRVCPHRYDPIRSESGARKIGKPPQQGS